MKQWSVHCAAVWGLKFPQFLSENVCKISRYNKLLKAKCVLHLFHTLTPKQSPGTWRRSIAYQGSGAPRRIHAADTALAPAPHSISSVLLLLRICYVQLYSNMSSYNFMVSPQTSIF